MTFETIINDIKNNSITDADFSKYVVDDAGAFKIAVALKSNTTLKTLNLSTKDLLSSSDVFGRTPDPTIGAEGMTALANTIQVHPTLHTLNLRGNAVGYIGFKAIVGMIQKSKSLRNLNLGAMKMIEKSAELVTEALIFTRLESLSLELNHLNEKSVLNIATALKASTASLKKLKLSHCEIGVTGAKAITDALQGDVTLKALDMSNNPIGGAAINDFAIMMTLNDTLRDLNLSTTVRKDDEAAPAAIKHLAEVLEMSKLRSLDLSCISLSRETTMFLVKALSKNPDLRTLGLRYNGIDDLLAGKFCDALLRNSNIVKLEIIGSDIIVQYTNYIKNRLEINMAFWIKPYNDAMVLLEDNFLTRKELISIAQEKWCLNSSILLQAAKQAFKLLDSIESDNPKYAEAQHAILNLAFDLHYMGTERAYGIFAKETKQEHAKRLNFCLNMLSEFPDNDVAMTLREKIVADYVFLHAVNRDNYNLVMKELVTNRPVLRQYQKPAEQGVGAVQVKLGERQTFNI